LKAAGEVQPPSRALTGLDTPRRPVCAPGSVSCSWDGRPLSRWGPLMHAHSWLRPLAARLPRTRGRRAPQRPAFRPRLEALEDRLTPSDGGLLDPTFGSGGIVTSSFSSSVDRARDVLVQPDGKLVIAGFTDSPSSRTARDSLVARYNPDGTLDSSF